MRKRNTYLILLFSLTFFFTNAQSWGDYTLIARQNSNAVSLINLNKTVVKTWALTGNTGYSTYLLPGGDLLRTVMHTSNSFSGGGMTGRVQKVSFSGTLLWDYVYSTSTYCMHHDICPLPNGNVLIIAYESKTAAEVTAAGGSFGNIVWSEKIVELQPSGLNGANIVWEWNLWDHLAQNIDASKKNYVTSIVDNPQLMNINYNSKKDWVHMNGIDYNSVTDQIVVSSHNLNELWLIDHSTTSAQAASHSGGNSGKGGDLLYRWGNPAAYSAAGATVFNVVHDAHWVTDGPYTGYFAAFNNRGISSTQSSVDYILPDYNLTLGQAYLPSTYSARKSANGYSSNMSNSQQLPNGNTLICVATAGNIYEINAAGSIVWQYNTGGTTPQARRYEASFFCTTPPTSSASATPKNACSSNFSVALNANATGTNLTYAWSSSPAGFSSTSATPTVTPTITTTYTVTATSGLCSTISSVVVAGNTKPTVSITPSPSAAICAGNSVMLTANPTGGSDFSYNWSGGNLNSTSQNPNFVPTNTGTYSVTVTNNAGCTGTATQKLIVNPLPNTPTIIQKGDTLISSALLGNRWYFNNSLLQDTTIRLVTQKSGSYQVQAININGCKSALSTNYNFIHSGIFDILKGNILTIFPNPTSGLVELKGDFLQEGDFDVIVYNTQGQVVQSLRNVAIFDLSNFSNQLFFVVLRSTHFGTQTGKVLLER